jgi:hypothetical protein
MHLTTQDAGNEYDGGRGSPGQRVSRLSNVKSGTWKVRRPAVADLRRSTVGEQGRRSMSRDASRRDPGKQFHDCP